MTPLAVNLAPSTTLADMCHGFFASAYGNEGMWVAAGD